MKNPTSKHHAVHMSSKNLCSIEPNSIGKKTRSILACSLMIGFAVCSIALGAGRVEAASYYIDNSQAAANDANAGTSMAQPWKSLRAISMHTIKPGDVISLSRGTSYTGGAYLKLNGTSTNHITLTAYGTGSAPVLSNNLAYLSYSDALDVISSSYLDINGLKFTNASQAGINIDSASQYITVSNSEMTGVGIGVRISGRNSLLTQNTIHNLIMVKNNPNDAGDYGANGFVIAGPNNEFSYNQCNNCSALSAYYGIDGGMFELYQSADNTYIHHNISQNSAGFLEAGGSVNSSALNVRVEHNVSYNNGGLFVCLHFTGNFALTRSSFSITNNTVVELTTTKLGSLNYVDLPTMFNSVSFVNNLFVIKNIASFWKYPVGRSNNAYQNLTPGTHMMSNWDNTMGPGEVWGDLKLADVVNGNLNPSAGSLVISKSLPNPTAEVDFNGTAIPALTIDDIGAFKYLPGNLHPNSIGRK